MDTTAISNVTADIIRSYMAAVQEQQRAVEAANDETAREKSILRTIYKRAKADGLDTDILRQVIKDSRLEREEVVLRERQRVRYLGLKGIELPRSMLFLDVDADGGMSEDEMAWQAEEAGYGFGRAGGSADDNPNRPGSLEHQSWQRGHHRGAEAAARRMLPGEEAAPARRGRRPGGASALFVPPEAPKPKGRPRGRPKGSRNNGPVAVVSGTPEF